MYYNGYTGGLSMIVDRKAYFLFIIIFILAALVGCSPQGTEKIESGKDITMFVATDIHYLDKKLSDYGEAFEVYAASGDGKQINYVEEIVDAFSRDIKKAKPDILIISGDLTNNGEKENHLMLAKKLINIEKTGTRVFVIPGNHDIQNPWARGFKGSNQYKVGTVDKDDFYKIYRKFGYDEAISTDQSTLSYLAAPSEDVWLLMLDTNQYEYNEFIGMPATNGIIRSETLEWIRQCSELAKANNAQIITVMHHNLMDHSDLLSEGYTLDNSKEAIETLKSSGLNLVLSGHIHIQDIQINNEGVSPIYDISTSALSIYPQQYGVLKFLPAEGIKYNTSLVDVEGWAKEKEIRDKNMLNFKAYSKNHFAKASFNKAYDELKKMDGYSEEERKLMAETMSILNTNYFAGTVASVRNDVIHSPGYKLWSDAKPPFFKSYVLSMVADSYRNKTELIIPKQN
jgi:3',5'-cyclic AMP phosphodiesterase CpdA